MRMTNNGDDCVRYLLWWVGPIQKKKGDMDILWTSVAPRGVSPRIMRGTRFHLADMWVHVGIFIFKMLVHCTSYSALYTLTLPCVFVLVQFNLCSPRYLHHHLTRPERPSNELTRAPCRLPSNHSLIHKHLGFHMCFITLINMHPKWLDYARF